MKYLQTYNESLRDKMTPKSKEEILKKIKGLEPEEILKLGADSNTMELIDIALEEGADVNHSLAEALLSAAMKGHVDITKKLLQYGADPNLGFKYSIYAIYNKFEIMKLLIEYGLDINADDDQLLILAVHAHDYDLIQLLLDKGANPNAKNGEPLRDILKFENSRILQMLLDAGADIHINNDEFLRRNLHIYWDDVRNTILDHLEKEKTK